MRIYRKNLNKTAESIVGLIKEGKDAKIAPNGMEFIYELTSYEAYRWLKMNANPLAELVEELLDDKYKVVITPNYGERVDCGMYIEWKMVEP